MLNRKSSSAPSAHCPRAAAPAAATSIKVSISNLRLRRFSIASVRSEPAAEHVGGHKEGERDPAIGLEADQPTDQQRRAAQQGEDQFGSLAEEPTVSVAVAALPFAVLVIAIGAMVVALMIVRRLAGHDGRSYRCGST
ncbi:hypothetical protein ACRAWD_05140 [Caulobacter segnis]